MVEQVHYYLTAVQLCLSAGFRHEGAEVRGLQDPPVEQGLERREEGQLHQARPPGVQHPQEPPAPEDRQPLRRLRNRRQLILHRPGVLRRTRPRLLSQTSKLTLTYAVKGGPWGTLPQILEQ